MKFETSTQTGWFHTSADTIVSVFKGEKRHELKFEFEGLRYAEGSDLNEAPCVNLQDEQPTWFQRTFRGAKPRVCGHLAFEHYEEHAAAMFNNMPCGVKGCSCLNFWTADP
jgi:hypothetical protein